MLYDFLFLIQIILAILTLGHLDMTLIFGYIFVSFENFLSFFLQTSNDALRCG